MLWEVWIIVVWHMRSRMEARMHSESDTSARVPSGSKISRKDMGLNSANPEFYLGRTGFETSSTV
jgi:hypothetical protein